jgi:hypothetical protein
MTNRSVNPADIFTMACLKLPYLDLNRWLLDTATLQEAHPFHRMTWADFVPGAQRFRQHAASLSSAVIAAENKDIQKVKELEQEHKDTLLSILMNAGYIVLRYYSEKDESVLHNTGYVLKEKTQKIYAQASIKAIPLKVHIKTGPDPGSVVISIEKDPAAGAYGIQMCKGAPTGEESWRGEDIYRRRRVIIYQLDRANWWYFRVRSYGDNETSPWSAPVGIIVV